MALPSSPPLLPTAYIFDELPSSPPPLPTCRHPTSRKRQASDYSSLSSDPVFSEDASDADVSHYQGPRKRKRNIRGPWWSHDSAGLRHRVARKESKRRNIDSGVWMGSDSSDADAFGIASQASDLSDDSVKSSLQGIRRLHVLSTPTSAELQHTMNPEDLALQSVIDCLENGNETVDLSGIRLKQLPGNILRPLQQLVRQVHVDARNPPSEEEFAPLTPSIKLFLSGNNLRALPSDLFDLTNLSVLSLRNNELGELPPAIARLSRLKELNVAGNGLRWLPWQLLKLLSCDGGHKQITIRPNPFLEYVDMEDSTSASDQVLRACDRQGLEAQDDKEQRLLQACDVCHTRPIYITSSEVTYFNIDGTIDRSLSPQINLSDEDRFSPVPEEQRRHILQNSAAPSLFELALRSVQSTYDLSDLAGISNNDAPSVVLSGLYKASLGQEMGNQACSTCERNFIIARAEWMEYWHCGQPSRQFDQEAVLPLLRKTCSIACATPTKRVMYKS
ncbi:hypothetical protein K431DRAFT_285912 [Polychaeton citri CBS 116435]|uniref:L domain-like protein n=1 Tax=Polychaeton citri CBS 116435 TaxID=1314669 RepID=A0A9P4UP98_9PEZI|nr:hypothetical protein K431DRAFT_285912 [Polychaeton citri CBS 116435]